MRLWMPSFTSVLKKPTGKLSKKHRLLVFLLVPEHATEEHLEILSELAELLSDTGIRETLLTSDDAAAIHRVLATWEPYRPAA